MDQKSVIVQAKRTPIGSFQGQLSGFSSPELAAAVIKSILSKVDLQGHQIDEVILGNVL
ncbi:acetyl-CoA C-acetyltransferase, partial [Candidatus Marinimicrobia bacterium]|nr:acetyl-CoA C-acetyltransferase [Candidatus Neomarinimicrobiota bacterium]